jgi:hypothetical protein
MGFFNVHGIIFHPLYLIGVYVDSNYLSRVISAAGHEKAGSEKKSQLFKRCGLLKLAFTSKDVDNFGQAQIHNVINTCLFKSTAFAGTLNGLFRCAAFVGAFFGFF